MFITMSINASYFAVASGPVIFAMAYVFLVEIKSVLSVILNLAHEGEMTLNYV